MSQRAPFSTFEQRIIGRDLVSSGVSHSYALMVTSGNFKFEGSIGGSAKSFTASAVPVSSWSHIAAVYNGSQIILFQDGIITGNISSSGGVDAPTFSSDVGIGNQHSRNRPFNGSIDEVAIWNRSLSGLEINSSMISRPTSVSNTNDLVGYWKFDEGRGVLICNDFSQVVVTTNCGGVSTMFDKKPTCN